MSREASGLQTVAKVRGVFARHWLDLGLIIIMFSQGTIRLQGKLQKLQRAGEPVDEALLSVLEQEIKRVPDVKRVNFGFDNWVKTSVGWERIEERKADLRAGAEIFARVSSKEEKEEKPAGEKAEDRDEKPGVS